MKDTIKKKESWLLSDKLWKRAVSIYLHWIVGTIMFWATLAVLYALAVLVMTFLGL